MPRIQVSLMVELSHKNDPSWTTVYGLFGAVYYIKDEEMTSIEEYVFPLYTITRYIH